MSSKIERGAIIMCDLGVKNTSIQRGLRPCVVVSNDKANFFSNVIMAVPLTTKIDKCYPTQVIIEPSVDNNMKNTSLVLCEQIVPINKKEQVKFVIGSVTREEMGLIDKAIMVALGFFNKEEVERFDYVGVKTSIREELRNERLNQKLIDAQ